jgi:hypothetical protein
MLTYFRRVLRAKVNQLAGWTGNPCPWLKGQPEMWLNQPVERFYGLITQHSYVMLGVFPSSRSKRQNSKS